MNDQYIPTMKQVLGDIPTPTLLVEVREYEKQCRRGNAKRVNFKRMNLILDILEERGISKDPAALGARPSIMFCKSCLDGTVERTPTLIELIKYLIRKIIP